MEAGAAAPVGDPTCSGFQVNEKVLVPHTDKYYEAKILKSEWRTEARQWYYFLHYTGWNKKYDEWVEEHGIVKTSSVDPAAAQASKKAKTAPASKAPAVKVKAAGQAAPPAEAAGSVVNLDLPIQLKKVLLDDYEAVVEEGKVAPLPRSPSVSDLLQQYVQEALTAHGNADSEDEVASGLKAWFDRSLQVVLLYRSERAQATKMLADGRTPSSVYGAEHLCRLFVQLPNMLSTLQCTDDQLAQVSVMVQDVMSWMVDNAGTLFISKAQYVEGGDSML